MNRSARLSGHRLQFPQLEREIEARAGESVFAAARRHGVRIVGACGGRGVCGSCLIAVRSGVVVPIGPANPQGADRPPKSRAKRWVRACQVSATSDAVIEIAPRSLAPIVRAETDPVGAEILPLVPVVRPCEISVAEPTLADPRSDAARVFEAVRVSGVALEDQAVRLTMDLGVARALPATLRAASEGGRHALRAWVRSGEVVAIARSGSRGVGLAVDLGTTNIAAFIVDLATGARLASLGTENPQVAWGADVISRMNHAIQDEQVAAELRVAATEAINAMAHDLCQTLGLAADHILDVTICGNTAMHHLLLGLPVRQLGRAPFVAATHEPLDVRARELGLATAPGARVHVAGGVGGFVGGDHVMALLATEEHWRSGAATVVMDIGTNTEISVIHAGRLLSASSPSGPALEGGHISCGMRAADGAIERVSLLHHRIHVETIGRKPAIGLCGSGVLDAVATLRRGGFVTPQGRIESGRPEIVQTGSGRAVRLARHVEFTQHDVRAVQLAKAAIRTATDLLLAEAGLDADAVTQFIIAGAFGAYIGVDSGIAIGLFPALPRARFRQVGNAAGLGIRRVLASTVARARAAEIAALSHYVELSSRGDFQKRFLQNIGFPPDPSLGTLP